ncbi:TetR/AcrR family transcriptional regulator [Angustibacter luteus]|uniref:TetR/AcrR family transcriptional regulator n=1 Tax=Angustibacter luteus TaxID=658456 RepID=A0ABW1JFG1_9ACTN
MPSHATPKAARTRLAPVDRRDQLIRAAVEVFAEEGLANASIVDITKHAGVSNGTFYHYFADKRDIAEAVGALVISDMTSELTAFQEALEIPRRIAVGAFWVMRRVATNPSIGAVMAEYFEQRSDVLRQTATQLGADLRTGITAGAFDIEPDDVPMFVQVWGSMFGVGAREVLSGSEPRHVGTLLAIAQLRMLGLAKARAQAVTRAAERLVLDS